MYFMNNKGKSIFTLDRLNLEKLGGHVKVFVAKVRVGKPMSEREQGTQ